MSVKKCFFQQKNLKDSNGFDYEFDLENKIWHFLTKHNLAKKLVENLTTHIMHSFRLLPPVKWTTALPAKSWKPLILSHPSGCQAQWAITGYIKPVIITL